MNNVNEKGFFFSNESLADALQIWNRSAISLIDIRHKLISPDDALRKYRMPASMFVYTNGAKSEVSLDDTAYNVERFGLFHGGKGTELSIIPKSDCLEYYMVFYKAGESPFHKREFKRLMEKTNPFRQQYGFEPSNPIFMTELLRRMFEIWKQPTPLEMFYEKSAFYQLVYEIYQELCKERIQVFQPDVVSVAKRYIDEHYSEGISIQSLAELLGLSPSYFRSLFKKREGISPQEYLVSRRISDANNYLEKTDYSLREIALSLGFYDEYHFNSAYKKATGMTPQQFKAILAENTGDSYIENLIPFPYNKLDQVSLGKLEGKGEKNMFKHMRNKTVIAAALSLMLLLSACGTAPATSNRGDSAPTSVVSSQVAETETLVDAGMKTVNTIRGNVEIPQNPQKVVVLNYAFGDVLALGVTPAAVNDYWAIPRSALEGLLQDIPRASELEEILSIEPDLILTAFEKDEDYEKLSKIAPTVSFGSAKDTTQQTLEERLTFLSEILGVDESTKDKVLSDYYAHIQQTKESLVDAGFSDKTFTIILNSLDESGIVVSSYKGAKALYDELGMLRSEKGQELYDSGEWYADLSLEVLPGYCGDYIIICYGDEGYNVFSGNGVYENIEAVKNGNVIMMDEYLGMFNDVISVRSQVDFIAEQLLSMEN